MNQAKPHLVNFIKDLPDVEATPTICRIGPLGFHISSPNGAVLITDNEAFAKQLTAAMNAAFDIGVCAGKCGALHVGELR